MINHSQNKQNWVVYADNANNVNTYSFIGFSFTQPDEPVITQLHTYKCITQRSLMYDSIITPQSSSCDNFADNVFANNANRQTGIPGSC